MKKFKNTLLIGLILILTVTGCKSVKDGLTGTKKNNNDEFLIEKKNPLTKPPDYQKLPTPTSKNEAEENKNDNFNIKELLGQKRENKKPELNEQNKNNSLEKSIIDKIKNR
tara:strand:+ start:193 stop:525 length:333 start_codon:yes stop_codon:yes gene_type:complete